MDLRAALLAVAALAFTAGGCGFREQRALEDAEIASAMNRLRPASDYRISAADLLSIVVFDNEKLNREVRVTQKGSISFPLLGEVPVGGLTVPEAERALSARLKDYVVDPQVTVVIRTEGIKKVFVLGQVLKPGACELPTEAPLTVLAAISMAGGFTPLAAADRTRVIRNANGKSQTFDIRVSDVTKRGRREKDIELEPNDIVYVPQSYF